MVIVGLLIAHMWWSHPFFSGTAVAIQDTAAVCLAFVLGVLSARLHPALPGLMVAGSVAATVVATLPESVSGSATAPPLGYGNADAALMLTAVAGALVAAEQVPPGWRPALIGFAVMVGAGTVATTSRAGALSCVVLALLWTTSRRGPPWAWKSLTLLMVTVPAALTVALAKRWSAAPGWLAELLSTNRLRLWENAAALADDAPLRGVGATRFAEKSAVARSDTDLAYAHSAALQRASEHGWLGLGIALLLIVWLVLTMGRDCVLVAALALPASVDYVGSFLWVTGAMAIVLGGAWALADHERVRGSWWLARRSDRVPPGRPANPQS